jgi:hypothetical protein
VSPPGYSQRGPNGTGDGRLGRLQRQIRRLLIARPDQTTFSTGELVAWAFPRLKGYCEWRWRGTRRAADRFLVRTGGKHGRQVVWRAKSVGSGVGRPRWKEEIARYGGKSR